MLYFQIGILIPLVFFEVCWWLLAVRWDYFSLFPERYILSITMIFGATVAGMTSEGGGAVAFPVMTLALGIAPSVARDFSLMIQVQKSAVKLLNYRINCPQQEQNLAPNLTINLSEMYRI